VRITTRLVPTPLRPVVRRVYLRARYHGDALECPCCGARFGRFREHGDGAICPNCNLLARHRAIWLWLRDRTNLFTDELRVLHFAPEEVLQDRLRRLPNLDYTSADLRSPLAMMHFDITDIPFEDDSVDVILCSHVLEHVPDDRRAMAEMIRVLKPGGWALALVPIDPHRNATHEDPTVAAPEDREREFGQADHVRLYGMDYPQRLEEEGFAVAVDDYIQTLDAATTARHALGQHVMIVGKKPPDRARKPAAQR
jgi:predicted SAM-dependent methyltransferase